MIKYIVFYVALIFSFNNALSTTNQSKFIKQAETYLNALNNMSAIFVQQNNQSEQSGYFMLSNSHNIRWEYKKPRNIVITFCHNKIAYHDKDLGNQEVYSLNNPFIEFIATRPINLNQHKNFFIKELKQKPTSFELTISNVKKSVGSFILVFNKKPVELKKLVVFDDFGAPIEITFNNIIIYPKNLKTLLFHCVTNNE